MKENNLDCPECRAKHPAANGFLSFPQNKYIICNVKRNAQFPTCEIHNRVMTLFCNETNYRVPICSLCLINDHENHGMKDFKEEYKETHDVLSLDLNSLKSNLQCKREEFMIKKEILRKETENCVKDIEKQKAKYVKKFDDMIKGVKAQMTKMETDR